MVHLRISGLSFLSIQHLRQRFTGCHYLGSRFESKQTNAALAAENSADETTRENGGLTENANRDSLSADLSAWLFAADRKAGDATVLEYTDSTGAVAGYQVIYADSFGEIRWKYQAANALRSADYEDWYAQVQESYPAALTDKAQQIPSL